MRSKFRRFSKIYALFMFSICVANKKAKYNNKKSNTIIKSNKRAWKSYILYLCLLYV